MEELCTSQVSKPFIHTLSTLVITWTTTSAHPNSEPLGLGGHCHGDSFIQFLDPLRAEKGRIAIQKERRWEQRQESMYGFNEAKQEEIKKEIKEMARNHDTKQECKLRKKGSTEYSKQGRNKTRNQGIKRPCFNKKDGK